MTPAILTVDFETYYADDFGFSCMTTEEYVRDPRFEVIGVSVQCDDGEPQWFSGTHQETLAWLQQFPWQSCMAVAHNGLFDFAILAWKFGIHPARMFCTLAGARWVTGVNQRLSLAKLAEHYGLGTKGSTYLDAKNLRRADMTPEFLHRYGEYCNEDVRLTYRLLQRLYRYIPEQERQLLHWTMTAFTQPTLIIDRSLVQGELTRFLNRRDALLQRLGVSMESLRSDGQFADLLRQLGQEPPMKLSPKRKNADGSPMEVFAFSKQDVEFVDLLESDNEDVAALVDARLSLKTSLLEGRLRRFIGISERGPLPVPLDFAGARNTRRWAGTDKINLQNLPRNPKGGKSPLRDAIKAPPGFKLGATDLSQIELRTNAWQAGQADILDLLRSGGDVYSRMATPIFGFEVNKHAHANERFVGKTAELGCGYQCGAEKFWHMLKVDSRKYGIPLVDESFAFAERTVKLYRETHAEIRAFWRKAQDAIPYIAAGMSTTIGPYRVEGGCVLLPDGVYLYYPNLRQQAGDRGMEWVYDRIKEDPNGGPSRTETTKLYGGKLVENITQAVAALFMKRAMLRIAPRFRVVGTVHDEILFLVPDSVDEAEAIMWVEQQMTVAPEWAPDIPLGCETHLGRSYADCK